MTGYIPMYMLMYYINIYTDMIYQCIYLYIMPTYMLTYYIIVYASALCQCICQNASALIVYAYSVDPSGWGRVVCYTFCHRRKCVQKRTILKIIRSKLLCFNFLLSNQNCSNDSNVESNYIF